MTISSANMADPPVINLRWLTHPASQAVAITSFKRVHGMFAQKSMAPVLIGPEMLPGNATVTDEQILDYIRSTATTIFHAACTCKVGRANDMMAVVDAKAWVYRVEVEGCGCVGVSAAAAGTPDVHCVCTCGEDFGG